MFREIKKSIAIITMLHQYREIMTRLMLIKTSITSIMFDIKNIARSIKEINVIPDANYIK